MNDNQLLNFMRVAEHGSITAAAQELFITPQALQQQMVILERDLGFRLMTRTKRGVALTEAGKEYYDGLTRLVPAYRELAANARKKSELSERTVTVLFGGYLTGPEGIFTAIYAFRKANPGIEVNIVSQGEKQDVLPDIVMNDVVPGREGFTESFPLYSTCFYALLRTGHPLLDEGVTWENLMQYSATCQNRELMSRLVPGLALPTEGTDAFARSLTPDLLYELTTTDRVAVLVDRPEAVLYPLTAVPIEGTAYDACLLTTVGARPIVMSYIGFLVQYFGRNRMKA